MGSRSRAVVLAAVLAIITLTAAPMALVGRAPDLNPERATAAIRPAIAKVVITEVAGSRYLDPVGLAGLVVRSLFVNGVEQTGDAADVQFEVLLPGWWPYFGSAHLQRVGRKWQVIDLQLNGHEFRP